MPNRSEPTGNDPKGPCPADVELAAFAEGRLDSERRAQVLRHLLRCWECREVIASTAEQDLPLGRTWVSWRQVATAAGIVLAILTGAATGAWWLSRLRAASGVSALVRAAADRRLVEGRLTGGFAWAPMSTLRGAAEPDRLEIAGIAARLRGARASSSPAADRPSLGVAYLLLGDVDDAIT